MLILDEIMHGQVPKIEVMERLRQEPSASGFVKTTFSDVADPLDNIMVRVVQLRLENFQKSNSKTRWSKWDL